MREEENEEKEDSERRFGKKENERTCSSPSSLHFLLCSLVSHDDLRVTLGDEETTTKTGSTAREITQSGDE